MNKKILVYLPTTILPLLFGANIATAQNMNDSIINQQVADSLAKNKKYQKFIKTAKIQSLCAKNSGKGVQVLLMTA